MGLGWLLSQKGKPVFTIAGKGFDLASIVMLAGGLFLIYKSVKEIHDKLEGEDPNVTTAKTKSIYAWAGHCADHADRCSVFFRQYYYCRWHCQIC